MLGIRVWISTSRYVQKRHECRLALTSPSIMTNDRVCSIREYSQMAHVKAGRLHNPTFLIHIYVIYARLCDVQCVVAIRLTYFSR